MVIGIIGLIISLTALMFFAYRGINVLILAPLCALLALLFQNEFWLDSSNGILLAQYTQVFMGALTKYLLHYFPLFLTGAIFGKLMSDTGAALAIGEKISDTLGPKHAVLASVMACGILTYGGVSLFVVAFSVYPIALALFDRAKLNRRFIPATIALGSFTFTMTALPGTPSVQNAIPMPFFGTTLFAAPGLGLIAGAIMLVLGVMWLNHRTAQTALPSLEGELQDQNSLPLKLAESDGETSGPSFLISMIPLLIVVVGNLILSQLIIPHWNVAYLALPKYGSSDLKSVQGLWSIIGSVSLAIAFILLFFRGYQKDMVGSLNKGTMGALLPVFNTASEVGYGSVIAGLAAFDVVKNSVLNIAPSNPLISESIAINVLSGITGSASGGLSIGLEILGAKYLELGRQLGISPELLHRVATLSCGSFDVLPHNGAVISLLTICAMTHKRSYFDIFVVACLIPAVSIIVVLILGSSFGSF